MKSRKLTSGYTYYEGEGKEQMNNGIRSWHQGTGGTWIIDPGEGHGCIIWTQGQVQVFERDFMGGK